MGAEREPIAVVTKLPADLTAALQQSYELIDHKSAGGARPGPRIAVTTSMAGADDALFASLPDLGLLACQGTGLDRIDLEAARRRGVAVAHTPDVLTEDVADFAIALMYGVARKVVQADRFVRDGRWANERMTPSTRLHAKTAGIVGLGKIGHAIARRAEGLGMHVAWTGPRAKPNLRWDYVETVAELAARADVLFVSAAGGEQTRHLIDAAALRALGPNGFLVNVARGSSVDEAALLEALEQGAIAGAGLDVFAREPDLDPRFLTLANVVLAPHYASLTHETRADIIGLILNNIAAFRAGQPFPNAAAL